VSAAQNVSGQVNFSLNFPQVQTTGLIQPATFNALLSQAFQYVNAGGGVAGAVDQLYAAQLTIASTTTTVHFANASAHDPWGNTLSMLRIREFVVQNISQTTGFDVTVCSSASDGVPFLAVAANQPPIASAFGGGFRYWDYTSLTTAGSMIITPTTDGVSFVSASHTAILNVIVLGCSVA
jgi:hypothetical protein